MSINDYLHYPRFFLIYGDKNVMKISFDFVSNPYDCLEICSLYSSFNKFHAYIGNIFVHILVENPGKFLIFKVFYAF